MAYLQGRGREPKFLPVSSLHYVTGYLLTYGVLVALERRAAEATSYAVNVSLVRTNEWMTAMGLFDRSVVDTTPAELTDDELKRWLIEVPSRAAC